jgi:hypothetical protein
VNIDINHKESSLAEAIDLRIVFYHWSYISFDKIVSTNYNLLFLTTVSKETMTKIIIPRLHFDQIVTIVFLFTFDSTPSEYKNMRDKLMFTEPPTLQITNSMFYKNYKRIIDDDQMQFYTNYQLIQFKPYQLPVVSSLKDILTECQFTSSILGTNSKDAMNETIGWRSGFRSLHFYKSMDTYLQISFGYLVKLKAIEIRQLSSDPIHVLFNELKITFSIDINGPFGLLDKVIHL